MPELPEVEVVRRGLDRWVSGRTVCSVEVLHPRAVRRHVAGPDDFAAQLRGRELGPAQRRGKYLWLPLPGSGVSLLGHLGMSGQLLVQPEGAPDEKHLRIRVRFDDPACTELRFVDQRTFGGLAVEDADPSDPDAAPMSLAHIARDPLDPRFDDTAFLAALRRRSSGVKRALLDQSLISGVGNIYADEALWRARTHWAKSTSKLRRADAAGLLAAVREVLADALAAGGTSFDSLYVNVNGESGYFGRSLAVYGREGEPCPRCGAPMRRASWMNRSSYFCPKCQRLPRVR
jgi:formamidopyrimidine-DNA glycosylase